MQIEGNIPNGMREVETAQCTGGVGGCGDAVHVEPLAREILNAPHHHQGNFVAAFAQDGLNVAFIDDAASFSWRYFDDVNGRITSVKTDLTRQGVLIGGKGFGFTDDFRALPGGSIKTHQKQVQIHRQRVHSDHFIRFGTHEFGEAVSKSLVVTDPGMSGPEMPFDAVLGPIVQFCTQCVFCGFGLKPQGIACEVNDVCSIVLGNMKIIPSGR